MAVLNESQIRVQGITLLEEKYSYSVIGKGRSKSWISKWAKRYKQSQNETLRNRYHGGRKSVLTAAAQNLIKQSKYKRGQSLRKLELRLKDKRLAGTKKTIRRYKQTTLKWKSFKRRNVPKLTDVYKVRASRRSLRILIGRVLCSVTNRTSSSTTYLTVRTTLCGDHKKVLFRALHR